MNNKNLAFIMCAVPIAAIGVVSRVAQGDVRLGVRTDHRDCAEARAEHL